MLPMIWQRKALYRVSKAAESESVIRQRNSIMKMQEPHTKS